MRRTTCALCFGGIFLACIVILLTIQFVFIAPQQTVDDDTFAVAIVRATGGRTGNWMFEHVFWRLMALQHHRPYIDVFQWYRCPSQVFDCGSAVDVNIWHDAGVHAFGLRVADKQIPLYPHQYSFYQPYRNVIRSHILKPLHCQDEYDLVVYMRLDDAVIQRNDGYDYDWYTSIPLRFYDTVLYGMVNATHPVTRVLVIGHPIDNQQRAMMREVSARVQAILGTTPTIHMDASIDADMQAIMNARVLIAAPSTFWFWPSFLSCVQHTVHVPRHALLVKSEWSHPTETSVCTTRTPSEPPVLHRLPCALTN